MSSIARNGLIINARSLLLKNADANKFGPDDFAYFSHQENGNAQILRFSHALLLSRARIDVVRESGVCRVRGVSRIIKYNRSITGRVSFVF